MNLGLCKTVSFGDEDAFLPPSADANAPSEDEVETPRTLVLHPPADNPTVPPLSKPFLTPILRASRSPPFAEDSPCGPRGEALSAPTLEGPEAATELEHPPAYCSTRVKYLGSPDVCLKTKARPASTPHILAILCGLKQVAPGFPQDPNASGKTAFPPHAHPVIKGE
jgi:hypothetical protein